MSGSKVKNAVYDCTVIREAPIIAAVLAITPTGRDSSNIITHFILLISITLKLLYMYSRIITSVCNILHIWNNGTLYREMQYTAY